MSQTSKEFAAALYERLKQSDLFCIYQTAFCTATGLPLRFVGATLDSWHLDDEAVNRSPFCEMLNLCKSACQACIETNRRLTSEASVNGPSTCHCFAGLMESAVPVRAGGAVVGYLKTGQVFSQVPGKAQFDRVLGSLGRKTIDKTVKQTLRTAYFQTQTVEPERYASMVVLLKSFADQLGRYAESLTIIAEGSEPAAVAKARRYIHEHLCESLTLSIVAHQAGLSESHFCRLFKDATGLTLTEYINRCRIKWAKQELLKPERRVSEIAFEVGYQSLSQFNRSFARIVGSAPTTWRRGRFAEAAD
jgi:AraC-like DNA-binding protein/ligand-binding sensor protein